MQKIKNISLILGIFLLGFIFCSMVQAQDDIKFDTKNDSGFYYTIQKGDTLWGLSQKFYNSQWDWPGLWEINKEIKNPHWIYPGNKIKLFIGHKVEEKPVEKTVQTKPALPGPIKVYFTYPQMDHIGFIRKTAEKSLGKIIREQDGNMMMSSKDIIYIKPSGKKTLIPGNKYQIFTIENIKEKIRHRTFKGIKHLIKAEIKVLEQNVDYVTAIITNSYTDANVGDMIMESGKRDMVLTVEENPQPIDAAIICSEDNTLMVNDHRIAFIDQGRQDNIKPGQIYSVMQENKSEFDRSNSAGLAPLKSGRLIVLHTEDTSATILILSSKRDIHPGDMVN